MRRLLLSFLLAALFHSVLFVMVPFLPETRPPELISNDRIVITLKEKAPSKAKQREEITKKPPLEHPEEKLVEIPHKEDPPPVVQKPVTIKPKNKKKLELNPPEITEKTVSVPVAEVEPIESAKEIEQETAEVTPVAVQPLKSVVEARPLYRDNPKPRYPSIALRRGWEGTVILAVTVLENGTPGKVRLHQSSGYELLDKSAMKAVRRWSFLPGTENGIPVEMDVLIPVHFTITR